MRHSKASRVIEPLESRYLLAALYLDPTFGELGTASFPFGTGADTAELILPLPGGQALVAGDIDDHAGLLRINSDGSLDTTFGTGGIATAGPEVDQIRDVVQLDNGKFLFAGETRITQRRDLIVLRFNSNGTIDTSFGGGDGVVTVTFGLDRFSSVGAMAVDANDRIVVVGHTRELFVSSSIVVVRLTTNGTLDTTFSGDGKLLLEGQTGTSVAIQTDGRILVGGYTRDTNLVPTGAFVYRLRANGSLDTTFDGDGKRDLAYSGTHTHLGTLLLQSSGKILVGGSTTLVNTSSGGGLITRLNTDGSTDTTFAQGGTHFFGTEPAEAGQMRIDSGGNIAGIHRGYFVRVDENGMPDPTIGNGVDGALILDVLDNDSMALVDDDTILFGGGDFDVSRLAPRPNLVFTDGSLFITGGEGDDTISLDLNGNDLDVTRNGVTSTISGPDVQSIDIELHGGSDQVTIDPDLEARLRVDLGEGNNTFSSGGMELSRLMTGSGNDTIALSVVSDRGGIRPPITTGAGNDSITLGDQLVGIELNAGDGDDTVLLGAGDEMRVHGGNGNDQITATAGHTELDGEAGNDTINGGSDRDDIDGGDGNDVIDAGGGNDVVETGDGLNTAMGGAGDDTLLGGILADSLVGGDGNDSLGAGNGDNTVFGGAGNDILRGGNDYDWMWGESGYDTMKGGLGGDFLHGGNGKDNLFGQEGNDRIYGSGNDDALDGGTGSDLLVAGDGNDKVWAQDGEADDIDGGPGNDQSEGDSVLDDFLNVETLL